QRAQIQADVGLPQPILRGRSTVRPGVNRSGPWSFDPNAGPLASHVPPIRYAPHCGGRRVRDLAPDMQCHTGREKATWQTRPNVAAHRVASGLGDAAGTGGAIWAAA